MSNEKKDSRKSLRNLEKVLSEEIQQLERLHDMIETLHCEIYNDRQDPNEEESFSKNWAANHQNLENMTLEAEQKQALIDKMEAQIEKLKDESSRKDTKSLFCVYCVDHI